MKHAPNEHYLNRSTIAPPADFDYNPNAMTAAPASAATTKLPCSIDAPAMISAGTGVGFCVAAAVLLLGLEYVLVGISELDDRTMVEVAVAWITVRVIVVVDSTASVVFSSCARMEGTRRTASVATMDVNRILKWCVKSADFGRRRPIWGATQ